MTLEVGVGLSELIAFLPEVGNVQVLANDFQDGVKEEEW